MALESVGQTVYMTRRNRLRTDRPARTDLTATGRFRIQETWPRSVAS
jgi:hypothetical protein